MPINHILPFVSTAVMAVFAFSVFQRYAARRNPAFLYWGIGLFMFGLGSLAEAILALGWNQLVFQGWWLFGAVLNPAWIGQGTLQLLFRKPWVNTVTAVLVACSIGAAWVVLAAPPDATTYQVDVAIGLQYSAFWPKGTGVRFLPIPFGTYGLITLVGGALYSAYLMWRKRVLPNRVIGNILIAVGALSAAGGSVLSGLGMGQFLYVSELIASIMMYAGFRMAAAPAPEQPPVEQPVTTAATASQ